MVPDTFQINVEDLVKWEAECRAIATRYETNGNLEKARFYFAAASLMNEKVVELTPEFQDQPYWA